MNKGSEVQRAAAFIHDCYGMYRQKECKSGMYKLNRYTKGDFLKARSRPSGNITKWSFRLLITWESKNLFILLKNEVKHGRGSKSSFWNIVYFFQKKGKNLTENFSLAVELRDLHKYHEDIKPQIRKKLAELVSEGKFAASGETNLE